MSARNSVVNLTHTEAIAAAEALGNEALASKLRESKKQFEHDIASLNRQLKKRAPAAMLRTETQYRDLYALDRKLDDHAVTIRLHGWAIKELKKLGHDMMFVIGPVDNPFVAWSGVKDDNVTPHERYLAAMKNNPQGLQMFQFHVVELDMPAS